MKKANLGELNKLYTQADAADREVFAEMRSNLLLVAGEHYSKSAHQNYRTHVRESRDLSDNQKLRLTKNHIHRVHRRYTQAISRYSGGVTVSPAIDNEVQDQKSADLNLAVVRDMQYRHKWRAKVRKYVDDFVDLGEVAVLVLWDPTKGDFVGYGHKQVDSGDGDIPDGATADDEGFLYDEDNAPVPDTEYPVFKGDFDFVRLYGFNVFRHPACKDMEDSPYIGYREMVSTQELRDRYRDDPDKLKFVEDSANEEFIVFDATRNGYDRSRGQTLVRRIFYKPCTEYPEGYFVYWTHGGIIEEGPLPFGIFPIVWKGFDEHATAPRGRSIIKQARPFQAEINRAASAQAMTQITIGDDKILYQKGSQLSQGALLPGVRGIAFNGKEPQILPGRDGGQYVAYIDSQIADMEKVLDLNEIEQEMEGQFDPFTMLYRSAKERERFSRYSEKFEEFHCALIDLFLQLAKKYYPDDMLIPAIGAKEFVNIAEFRSTVPNAYRIHVESEDETLETKFGKQLSIQHVLQYASGNLGKDDIGKLISQMPYGSWKDEFSDLTLDFDMWRNTQLALERGEFQQAEEDDNHVYMLKKVTARIRQPDFKFLRPEVQRLFAIKKQQHLQFKAKEEQAIIDAKNEYIPTDGPLIGADFFVADPSGDPSKMPKRVRLPQSAVDWLLKRLAAQGQDQQQLATMQASNLAELGKMLTAGGAGPGQAGAPPPMLPPGQAAMGGGARAA